MRKHERLTFTADWDKLIDAKWPPMPALPEAERAQVVEGARLTAAALAPASREVVIKALNKLRTRSVVRPEDSSSARLTVVTYSEDLMAYPADVVIEACDRVGRRERWWPAWSDLQAECDQLVKWRKAAYRHLDPASRPT